MRGVALFDVLVSVSVLSIAILGLLTTIPGTANLEANIAARERVFTYLSQTWEELYSSSVHDGFARYNDLDDDDPEGPGTAIGSSFDVPEYEPVEPGGRVARIEFPPYVVDSDAGVLVDETRVDKGLGMPRDLNGDGVLSPTVPLEEIRILPARIVMEWRGAGGRQRVEAIVILGGGS
jgi:hypothetical protein